MSIYAEVHIVLKDGRKFGTWDITQGSIRDAVLEVMGKCVPSEVPYGSVTVQGCSTLLQEMVEVFKDEVDFEFDAIIPDGLGDAEVFAVERYNFKRFKESVLDDTIHLFRVEQDEYSTAFLPSWVEEVLGINLEDEPDAKVFFSYCDSFLNGEIFFGVPFDDIESITLELS